MWGGEGIAECVFGCLALVVTPLIGLGLGMPCWYANGGMQKAIFCNLPPYVGLVMACLIVRRSLFAASRANGSSFGLP